MLFLLLLIPAVIYLMLNSGLWCLLRSLPSKNEDFIHF